MAAVRHFEFAKFWYFLTSRFGNTICISTPNFIEIRWFPAEI